MCGKTTMIILNDIARWRGIKGVNGKNPDSNKKHLLRIMKSVFLVHHSYELDGCDETKLIGVYSSEEIAKQTVEKFKLYKGFKEKPDCFSVDEYELDADNWVGGYSISTNIQVRNAERWVTVEAEILPDGNYKIEHNYHEDETGQEFSFGDIVRCEERTDEEGTDIYAVELIQPGNKPI